MTLQKNAFLWKKLSEIQPTEDKEYLCLSAYIYNGSIRFYTLLRKWQNEKDKFNDRGFIDVGNNIVYWCEIPELPKNIELKYIIK